MKPGVYRHFKGNYYLVLFTAVHSETGETMIVYKPLYENIVNFVVRPIALFNLEAAPGVERFTFVGPHIPT